ncbi:MAG: hypothetical protein V3573_13500 [Desulfovibrionaceae bacterium]
MNRSRRHPTLALLATVAGALLVTLLLLEAVFHLLPVNELLRSLPVNAASPMLRFVPDQTLLRSDGAFFSMRNTVHSNNYGFLNDQEYDPQAPTPLMAVIGDSYVEAAMVPYRETGFGRLAEALEGRMRVYSFGRSGAPLSQYLATASWVREEFSPQYMTFVIVGNDFDESLLEYKSAPGFHYFRREGGKLVLHRIDYTPGLGVKIVTRSRLLMYLFTNLHLIERMQQFRAQQSSPEYAGQTLATVSSDRLRKSQEAAIAFLDQLPGLAQLPPKKILFVVDGIRPALYDDSDREKSASTYFGTMRRFFLNSAQARGYRTVDMQEVFAGDWHQHRKRFDFAADMHWNSRGHALFAREVLESGLVEMVTPINERISPEAP